MGNSEVFQQSFPILMGKHLDVSERWERYLASIVFFFSFNYIQLLVQIILFGEEHTERSKELRDAI